MLQPGNSLTLAPAWGSGSWMQPGGQQRREGPRLLLRVVGLCRVSGSKVRHSTGTAGHGLRLVVAKLWLHVTALPAPSTSLGAHLGHRASRLHCCHPFLGLQEDGSVPSWEANVPSESLAQASPYRRGPAVLCGAGEGLFSCMMEWGWCWSPVVSAMGVGPAAVPRAGAVAE